MTDGKVFRGCMSDNTQSKHACEKGEGKCLKCSTNACNDHKNSGGRNVPHFFGMIFVVAILGRSHFK